MSTSRIIKAVLYGAGLCLMHAFFVIAGTFGTVFFTFSDIPVDGVVKLIIIGAFSLAFPGILLCLSVFRPNYVLSGLLSLLTLVSLLALLGVEDNFRILASCPMPILWILENFASTAVPLAVYAALAALSWFKTVKKRKSSN